jgi:hypothetical protein
MSFLPDENVLIDERFGVDVGFPRRGEVEPRLVARLAILEYRPAISIEPVKVRAHGDHVGRWFGHEAIMPASLSRFQSGTN